MNNAGLPGTGIGGFLYILLAIIMPFCELYLTLLGRSSWARWKLVLKQLFIAGGILAGVEGTAWAVSKLFYFQSPTTEILGTDINISHAFIAAPIILSLTTLTLVLGVISIWAFIDKSLNRNRLNKVR